jgi:hypothetical protein
LLVSEQDAFKAESDKAEKDYLAIKKINLKGNKLVEKNEKAIKDLNEEIDELRVEKKAEEVKT